MTKGKVITSDENELVNRALSFQAIHTNPNITINRNGTASIV